MRLIDADAFKEQVAAIAIKDNLPAGKCCALCKLIEMQPTARSWHKISDGDLPQGPYSQKRKFYCKEKGYGYRILLYGDKGFYYYSFNLNIGIDNEQIVAWMELPEYEEEHHAESC
ncbi:hypothetical protein NE564_25770 [Blautia producta]|nr:hypothetical protein [Blautia producta]